MRKIDAVHLFSGPSLSSGIFTLFGASSLLFVINNSYFANSGILTDLLLGKDSSQSVIEAARESTFEFSELTLGNPTLNKVLFFLFWMMIGLIVYAVVSTLGSTISHIKEDVESVRYINARKTHLNESALLRWVIRLSGILSIVMFYLVFTSFLLPFSSLASQAWLGSYDTFSGWLYGTLGFIVLVLSIHIFIVLIRITALKPRIVGGWDIFV